MKTELNLSNVQDPVVRDNFSRLNESIVKDPYISGSFKLVEGTVTGNNSGAKFRHNLKYVPKDAILTSAIWSGTIGVLTIRNDRFDETHVEVTVSGLSPTESVSFRALVGRIE